MKLEGWLQKSNLASVKRTDTKQLRSRILLGNYQVDTWVNADGTIKVEVTENTPKSIRARLLCDGSLKDLWY
jgi:hypothetical protein